MTAERTSSDYFEEHGERVWTVTTRKGVFEVVDESRQGDWNKIRRWSRALGVKEKYPVQWLERKRHLDSLETGIRQAGRSVMAAFKFHENKT